MYIPRSLRNQILEWYHVILQHPGATSTKKTIRQRMNWPGLKKYVNEYVKYCKQCQINKSPRLKYGHLPVRSNTPNPWEEVCVDLKVHPGSEGLNCTAIRRKDVCHFWNYTKLGGCHFSGIVMISQGRRAPSFGCVYCDSEIKYMLFIFSL